MVFSIRKPTHLIALLILMFVFAVFYILPFFILTGLIPSSEAQQRVTETYIVLNSAVTSTLLVGASIVWLTFVDNMRLKEILSYLKLTGRNIDSAFIWGSAVFITIFFAQIVIALFLSLLGVHLENPVANEIAGALSIGSMVFIAVVQSTSEEIFFRGFLLEKIGGYSGYTLAIFATAFLFGLAHMGYGRIYPIIMPLIMGLLLGYVVVRTKNLFSSITAHITFNLVSFALYVISQSIQSVNL